MIRQFGAVIDTALATSFDSHVIAGYKFIMRYYMPGDRIYVFGFSRGAFTARFLSRMISHVGLLSMGNEELVPFAYKVYQDYEENRNGTAAKLEEHAKFMNSFKTHFCRTEINAARAANVPISSNESGIKVHFLGLFDCVSSVGTLDVPFFKKTLPLPAVRGTAKHIRHAVAIDERRVKFKAALFSQEQDDAPEDIKEVWFPGNHGDIGGGWDVAKKEDGTARQDTDDDYFQLCDITLKWMIDEIDNVEKAHENPIDRLAWDSAEKASFLRRFQKHKDEMVSARMHDTMTWNGGSTSTFQIMMWNFMGTSVVNVYRARLTPAVQNCYRGSFDGGSISKTPRSLGRPCGPTSAGQPTSADAATSRPPRSSTIQCSAACVSQRIPRTTVRTLICQTIRSGLLRPQKEPPRTRAHPMPLASPNRSRPT